MAVDFLTEEQKAQYGNFFCEPNNAELARYFHFDETDLSLIRKRRGDHNKLGFALQLTTVRFLGIFVSDLEAIPKKVKRFVAKQLSFRKISILEKYAKRDTTKREHVITICKIYGYHDFNEPVLRNRLKKLLYTKAWFSNERPSRMFSFCVAWLIENKVLLPGLSILCRLIAEVRENATQDLWLRLSSLPTEEQKIQLETLLQVPEGSSASRLDLYRKGPTTISSKAFITSLNRYIELQEFRISQLDFSDIPPVRLKNLARHAGVISMHKIARMPANKRIAILVAFVKSFEVSALDDALDIVDLLITGIAGEAKKIGQKNRLRTLKDLDKSALALAGACALVLDETTENNKLRSIIFARTPKEKLAEFVETVNNLARPSSDRFHNEMVEQYGKVRRFLPHLLNNIVFKAAPGGRSTLDALIYLTALGSSRRQILIDPPLNIVNNSWKKLVFDKDGNVNKRGYTLCFLDKLQDALRRRDVYVENSDRWGDPRSKLLQGIEWKQKKIEVCQSLGHSITPNDAITMLTEQLDTAYKTTIANFDSNSSIQVDNSGKQPSLTIENLDKVEDSSSLVNLRRQVTELLPKIDLTELILEINAHTGFCDAFTHVSESNAKAENIITSICAVLLAEACNIGIKPLIKNHRPELTRYRLNWVKQNYLRAETITQANAKLVDYQATLPLANKWGGGEVASADGMRFVVPIKTINARPNKKYFGFNKGITWYNFLSDQYSGFHGIVVPGTLRDSVFLLEGLLEQQTGLNPTEIMTDTAGTSDMVFGLFWLLGYQFSPRLADAGESKFWRIDKEAHYGILDEIARGHINTGRIEQQWDDMMRIAGSLKLGIVQASELIRSLLKSERPSSLAQAIIEVGRINKTLYLLNYVSDEDYRRRILTQLNRGEARHAVARTICHGQRGEIRKRYREGQEDQLGALGLVTNAVVLWNTIYMERALDHLRQVSQIRKEDETKLSPLLYEHINVLGHYSFTLSEQIYGGNLRPLSQPTLDFL